jgi:hypothetical protein
MMLLMLFGAQLALNTPQNVSSFSSLSSMERIWDYERNVEISS